MNAVAKSSAPRPTAAAMIGLRRESDIAGHLRCTAHASSFGYTGDDTLLAVAGPDGHFTFATIFEKKDAAIGLAHHGAARSEQRIAGQRSLHDHPSRKTGAHHLGVDRVEDDHGLEGAAKGLAAGFLRDGSDRDDLSLKLLLWIGIDGDLHLVSDPYFPVIH